MPDREIDRREALALLTSVPIASALACTSGDVAKAQEAVRNDYRIQFDPAAFHRLQAEVAEHDAVSARGVTFYTSSLAFSVLDPLGHLRHWYLPLGTFPG